MKKTIQQPIDTPARDRSVTDEDITRFRAMVLGFYKNRGRHDMLWRHTDNPYHILVSEIMLQQTQVERVAVKFPEFTAAFPDVRALARAPQSAVVAAWQGMGYNRRAIALRHCAEKITDEFGGVLPCDPAVLETFPGIGPATASSICAFAFNAPVVFIETNIRRVFIHHFFPERDDVSDHEILPLVARALDHTNPREWYWALMDYGAALKKRVPNPNRRSTAYTRQKPFEGSDRRIRGQILKMLVGKTAVPAEEICDALHEEKDRVYRLLCNLEKEQFLVCDSCGFRLAE